MGESTYSRGEGSLSAASDAMTEEEERTGFPTREEGANLVLSESVAALRERIESAHDGLTRAAVVAEAASKMASQSEEFAGGIVPTEGDLAFLGEVVAERDREMWRNQCNSLPDPESVIDVRPIGEPVVSVIIPVYNAALFLEETLDCVLRQTLDEIEVICLDDGSTDNSLRILCEAARNDDRVAVYHQDNLGLSSTRNRAMRLARGRYVYFLDADDLLEDDALAVLSRRADADQLDIVYLDGQSFYDDETLVERYPFFQTAYQRKSIYEGVWRGADLMAAFWGAGDLYVPPWLALYRRDYLIEHGIGFIDGIVHEDNAYYALTALYAERVAHCPRRLIRRRVHEDSIMTRSVAFANALGYYLCAIAVLRAYFDCETEMSVDTRAAVKAFAMRTLRSAATSLEKVPECEWAAVYGLREDCEAMRAAVSAPAYVGLQRGHLQRDIARVRDELSSAREMIRAKEAELDKSCTQLHCCEKEIEGLQDRLRRETGARIACEDEIARLRASKSYRVGYALVRPFIVLRRCVRRLRS